jgi:hypothetical protein
MRRSKNRVPRRGYSLIEIVLVIGSVWVVLVLCALLLHALLRLDRAGRSDLTESFTISRLARQFRADVRAATEAQPDAKGLNLTRADGRSIVYRAEARRLVREESEAGSVRRREAFSLSRLAKAGLEKRGGFVRLTLDPPDQETHGLRRESITIDANLAKDRQVVHLP